MVQAVLPDLVSSIATGFDTLTSKLQVLQSSQEDSNKKMNEHFAKFFALGNACFNGSSSSSVPSSLPSSLVSPATLPSPNSVVNAPTAYSMNRSLVSITDVWREYAVGLFEGPSVKRLEEQFGTSWRKDRKESRFFSTLR